MSTLSIQSVTRRFGEFTALDTINVEAATGEFLTLLGPSGCGKSTLLSIIAGLDRPTTGAILIDGQDVSQTAARDRDIAMIFQSYALYPNMTVAGNIAFGLKMRGVARAERDREVAKVGELLRISHLLDRKPYQLSGGQRQRVAMGRALVRHPRLFLFDEPLSNLDAQLRSEMRVEIKRLHQRLGATIVYVTHDQVEAMTMSTKVVVMNGGKIVQMGTPAEIYDRPNDLFVARFVGSPAMNLIAGQVRRNGAAAALQVGGEMITLPKGAAVTEGQAVTLGLRPESLVVADAGAGGLRMSATVDVLEPTGADTLVLFAYQGAEITARMAPSLGLKVGDRLELCVPDASLHLFDTASGRRIPSPPG